MISKNRKELLHNLNNKIPVSPIQIDDQIWNGLDSINNIDQLFHTLQKSQLESPLASNFFTNINSQLSTPKLKRQLSDIKDNMKQPAQSLSTTINMSSRTQKINKSNRTQVNYDHQIMQVIEGKNIAITEEFCDSNKINFVALQKINQKVDRMNFILNSLMKQEQEAIDKLLKKLYNDHSKQKQDHEKNKNPLFEWLELKTKFQTLKLELQTYLAEIVLQQSNHDTQQISQLVKQDLIKENIPNKNNIHMELNYLLQNYQKVKKNCVNQTNFEWNLSQEQQFLENRNKIKSKLGNLINSTNFDQVALSELIYKISDSSKAVKRQKLLSSYREGEHLNQKHYKFLANTSQLLNSKIDKEYLQNLVDYIDEEVIQDIELNIAERVLEVFENNCSVLKQQRWQWIAQQLENKKKLNKNIVFSEKNDEKIKEETKKYYSVQMMKIMVEKYEKKKLKQLNIDKKLKKKGSIDQINIDNQFVIRFKKIVMDIVKKYRAKQKQKSQQKVLEFLDRNTAKTIHHPFKDTQNQEYSVKQVKYKFHPCSKLLYNFENEEKLKIYRQKLSRDYNHHLNKEYEQFKSIDEQQQNLLKVESQKYRLPIRNNYVSQQEIQNFYSGGPDSVANREEFQNDLQIQICAINLIKRAMKRYILKKKFEQGIEICKMQKNKQSPRQMKQNKQRSIINLLFSKPKSSKKIIKINSLSDVPNILSNKNIQEVSSPQNYKKNIVSNVQLYKIRKLFSMVQKSTYENIKISQFKYDSIEVNSIDDYNNTPLFYAAQRKSIQICQYLFELGANPNIICSKGNTPTHICFKSNDMNLCLLFLQNKADVQILNELGQTPIAFCDLSILENLNLANYTATKTNQNEKSIKKQKKKFNSLSSWQIEESAQIKFSNINSPKDSVRETKNGIQVVKHFTYK